MDRSNLYEQVLDRIEVLTHSSIRIAGTRPDADESGEPALYFDPYEVTDETHDADVIFFTHSHYDHFSPDDYEKVRKDLTIFVMPQSMAKDAEKAGIAKDQIVTVTPGQSLRVLDVPVEAVAAYNTDKDYHPRENGWVGYVVTLDGVRVYVSGDTDQNEENSQVRCDIALVPVGGTFTFTAEEAADFINDIRPAVAIPTHYGTVVGTKDDAARFAARLNEGIRAAKF